jgi:hypothetical protein
MSIHTKLAEFVDREVEIWTEENTEPWIGILKEASPDYVCIDIDHVVTYISLHKIVAFRLSEGEQDAPEEGEEVEEEDEDER